MGGSSSRGKYQRPWILDDEAMKLSARTFIMENAAPKGLPNMKVLQGSGCIAWDAEARMYRMECIMMVMIVRMPTPHPTSRIDWASQTRGATRGPMAI